MKKSSKSGIVDGLATDCESRDRSNGLIAIDVDGSTAAYLLQIISNDDLPLTPEWTSGKPGKRQLVYQLPEAVQAQLHCFNRSVLNE